MYAKLEIQGTIVVKTGLHIGGGNAYSAIGAVDSTVIRDTVSGKPMIPGSSLKGKLRTLLAKRYNRIAASNPNEDAPEILSLFGNSTKDNCKASRLLFTDMVMSNWEDLKKMGVTSITEVKFENTINRATAVANPRQIERVIAGSEFPLSIIYEYVDDDTMKKDMEMLAEGFKLLSYDYLGGNGSRGYGKVEFKNLELEAVIGEVDDALVAECADILKR